VLCAGSEVCAADVVWVGIAGPNEATEPGAKRIARSRSSIN
jgi:hypothetical protein